MFFAEADVFELERAVISRHVKELLLELQQVEGMFEVVWGDPGAGARSLSGSDR